MSPDLLGGASSTIDDPLGGAADAAGLPKTRLMRRRASTGMLASAPEAGEVSGRDLLKQMLREIEGLKGEASGMLMERIAPALEVLPEEEHGGVQRSAASVVGWLAGQATEKLESLSQALQEQTRKQLKAQQTMFTLKIEQARTAASVTMKNKAAELEAGHNQAISKKLAQAAAGGDELLKEAHEKNAELTEQVHNLTVKMNTFDELAKTTQKLLRASETKVASLEEERAGKGAALEEEQKTLRDALSEALATLGIKETENVALGDQIKAMMDGITEAKASLQEALSSLDIKVDENKSLQEQIAEMVRSLNEAQAAAKAAQAEAEELRSRPPVVVEAKPATPPPPPPPPPPEPTGPALTPELEAELNGLRRAKNELEGQKEALELALSVALADAERAGAMEAAPCKEQVGVMVDRMRLEESIRRSGGFTPPDEQMQRLLDELKAAGRKYGLLEAAKAKVEEELDSLKQVMAEAGESGGAALHAAKQASSEAKAELTALRGEVEQSKKELSQIFTELKITNAKNQSLGETVKAVAQAAEHAKQELKESVEQKTSLQAKLQTKEGEAQAAVKKGEKLEEGLLAARGEIGATKDELRKVMASLDIKTSESQTLGEQVRAIRNKLNDAAERSAKLEEERDTMQEELARLKAEGQGAELKLKAKYELRIEQLEREVLYLRSEHQDDQAELDESTQMLSDALSSVGQLRNERSTLGEQVQLLVDKYRTARHTLKFLGRELEGTIGAMEAALEAKGAVEGRLERVSGDAKVKVQRLQEASKKERQALVHTALRSLDLLRSHLASHNAGTLQPPPPPGEGYGSHNASTTSLANAVGGGGGGLDGAKSAPPTSRRHVEDERSTRPQTTATAAGADAAAGGGGGFYPYSSFHDAAAELHYQQQANNGGGGTARSKAFAQGGRSETSPAGHRYAKAKHRWGTVPEAARQQPAGAGGAGAGGAAMQLPDARGRTPRPLTTANEARLAKAYDDATYSVSAPIMRRRQQVQQSHREPEALARAATSRHQHASGRAAESSSTNGMGLRATTPFADAVAFAEQQALAIARQSLSEEDEDWTYEHGLNLVRRAYQEGDARSGHTPQTQVVSPRRLPVLAHAQKPLPPPPMPTRMLEPHPPDSPSPNFSAVPPNSAARAAPPPPSSPATGWHAAAADF